MVDLFKVSYFKLILIMIINYNNGYIVLKVMHMIHDCKCEPGSGCGGEFEFLELENHLIISVIC